MKLKSILIVTVIFFYGCSAVPKMAPMLNNKGLEEKVNINDAGFIALSPITDYDEEVRIDIKNTNTNEIFRLKVNPSTTNSLYLGVGSFKVAEKKFEKNLSNKSVYIFQVTPGDYQFQYLYPKRKGAGKKITADNFKIKKKTITSFGEVELTYEKNILQAIKSMSVKSNGNAIDSLILKFEAYSVNSLDIHQEIINIGI